MIIHLLIIHHFLFIEIKLEYPSTTILFVENMIFFYLKYMHMMIVIARLALYRKFENSFNLRAGSAQGLSVGSLLVLSVNEGIIEIFRNIHQGALWVIQPYNSAQVNHLK